MTPEERLAREGLHPSVLATFVYAPQPLALTPAEFEAAFPIPKERIQRFYRDVHEALKQQAAQPDAVHPPESEPA